MCISHPVQETKHKYEEKSMDKANTSRADVESNAGKGRGVVSVEVKLACAAHPSLVSTNLTVTLTPPFHSPWTYIHSPSIKYMYLLSGPLARLPTPIEFHPTRFPHTSPAVFPTVSPHVLGCWGRVRTRQLTSSRPRTTWC
jgi:hypothetical protein